MYTCEKHQKSFPTLRAFGVRIFYWMDECARFFLLDRHEFAYFSAGRFVHQMLTKRCTKPPFNVWSRKNVSKNVKNWSSTVCALVARISYCVIGLAILFFYSNRHKSAHVWSRLGENQISTKECKKTTFNFWLRKKAKIGRTLTSVA